MSEVPLYRQQVAMQLTKPTMSWYYSRLVLVNSWYKRARISQLCLGHSAGGDICGSWYRGTSLIRNSDDLGTYSRNVSRALWWA